MALDYKVISTGSKGNAVRIDNILIDAGIPYKMLEAELYKVDYLLITHTHGDHLKSSTVNRIRIQFPHIKIIGNYEVAYATKVHIISGHLQPIQLGKWTVTPFPCVHDVVCQGFVLEADGISVIYATDTATLDNAPDQKYDYFFLESNHDANKITALRDDQSKYGYDAFKSAMRHLSTQASKAFYYLHRRGKESPWIELHQSMRFY